MLLDMCVDTLNTPYAAPLVIVAYITNAIVDTGSI